MAATTADARPTDVPDALIGGRRWHNTYPGVACDIASLYPYDASSCLKNHPRLVMEDFEIKNKA